MCQWCVEHGEGKKWYLNTRNYINKELFDSREEIRTAADMLFRDSERMFGIDMKKGLPLLDKPVIGKIVGRSVRKTIEKRERGQVIPVEEAKSILDNANMAALVSCVCRQSQLGITKAKYCLPFTYLADYGKEWPDFSKGGINYISIEEAKEAVEKAVHKGYVSESNYSEEQSRKLHKLFNAKFDQDWDNAGENIPHDIFMKRNEFEE
jgi:hypothetical protein